MIGSAQLPDWVAALVSLLLVVGAAMTLIGSIGLVRLGSFYARVHAPTLGTSLGTVCIAFASILYFSALENRPVLHEMLIILFVTVTTPVTLMILVRAATMRDRIDRKAAPADGDGQ
jgi:multicomponent K+:H+ antiporter subunit G